MTNYSNIKTGKDLIEAGIIPKTAKERMQIVLSEHIAKLREQHGGITPEVFRTLYTSTIAPMETAVKYTRSLLAGLDTLIFGPPGSGKTRAINDTIGLFPKDTFVVDNCEMQCNPYSLFDKDFAQKVPACGECKRQYGGKEYGETGKKFDPAKVNAKDVPVKLLHFKDGRGISRFKGSPDTYPEDLAGKIDIVKYQEIGDPFDPKVFRPGKISHGNNGIVNINELGKIPVKAQDTLLDALSESEVKPANTREAVPASALYLCDTNTEDLDRISGPLNDRLAAIFFPYPETVEANYEIIRRNIYKQRKESNGTSLEEVCTKQAISLLEMPIPAPLEKALCALMIDYRTGALCQKFEETGSNRALIDADKLARANAILYGRKAVGQQDLEEAMMQALEGNVRPRNTKDFLELSKSIKDYVSKKLPEKVQEECKTYWCEFAKRYDGKAQDLVPIAQEVQNSANQIVQLANERAEKRKAMEKADDEKKKQLAVEMFAARTKQLEVARGMIDNVKTKPFWDYVVETTPHMPVSDDAKDDMATVLLHAMQPHVNVPRTGGNRGW